jgi:hypothetical protein
MSFVALVWVIVTFVLKGMNVIKSIGYGFYWFLMAAKASTIWQILPDLIGNS